MPVLTCRSCGKKFEATALQTGQAVLREHRVFCAGCVPEKAATIKENGTYEVLDEMEIIMTGEEPSAGVPERPSLAPPQAPLSQSAKKASERIARQNPLKKQSSQPPLPVTPVRQNQLRNDNVGNRQVFFQSGNMQQQTPQRSNEPFDPREETVLLQTNAASEAAGANDAEQVRPSGRQTNGSKRSKFGKRIGDSNRGAKTAKNGASSRRLKSNRGSGLRTATAKRGSGTRAGISQRGSGLRGGVSQRGSRSSQSMKAKMPVWAWIGIGSMTLVLIIGGIIFSSSDGKGASGSSGGAVKIPPGKSGSFYYKKAREMVNNRDFINAREWFGAASDAYAEEGNESMAMQCNRESRNCSLDAKKSDLYK